jgi:EAL domain-containing protein (putative c-di-GMP-specific phosphodiesterase class I)
VKIDRSFAGSCDTDKDMMKIVQASIALARAFGMKAVAEGIDNPLTLRALRDAGCDIGQGYLFAPPLRTRQFAHLVKRWDSLAADGYPGSFQRPRLMTSLAAG